MNSPIRPVSVRPASPTNTACRAGSPNSCAPTRLAFTFGPHGDVSIQLAEQGSEVLLTLVHRHLPDRATTLKVAAGWHSHLDVLVARVSGKQPAPFWDGWSRLQSEYEHRLPA